MPTFFNPYKRFNFLADFQRQKIFNLHITRERTYFKGGVRGIAPEALMKTLVFKNRRFPSLKEPRHIDRLQIMRHRLKQSHHNLIITEPNRILLLYLIAPDAPHRLNNLLLCHMRQILPNKPMTERIVCPINIIRRRDNQEQPLFVCQPLHDLHILCVRIRREHPDTHQE